MSDTTSTPTKLCPTCGTRLSENATRCLVCGSTLGITAPGKAGKPVQGSRMPEITLSLPAALGFLALFLTIGAVLVFFIAREPGNVVEPTPTQTHTVTFTVTVTPTETNTPTPQPTATPLPPEEYTVAAGDTCSTIAGFFKVSVNSIILLNSLPTACDTLIPGQKLLIPQPTPTASPEPTGTLSPNEATDVACEKIDHTVSAGDTLSSIADLYDVSTDSIKEYNGLINDVVMQGFPLVIPLCERIAPGTTPTPTVPPDYPAPNLLLPANGAPFTLANDAVTLQWASVGTLRPNEAYAVTVEDITEGAGRKVEEYVTENKFIIPASFRPTDSNPHLIYWWVTPVRQVGTTNDGTPIWQPAGTPSEKRGLIWSGVAPAATPSPQG